jgi:hypothetical protein
VPSALRVVKLPRSQLDGVKWTLENFTASGQSTSLHLEVREADAVNLTRDSIGVVKFTGRKRVNWIVKCLAVNLTAALQVNLTGSG